MALDKAGLVSALTTIFEDLTGKSAAQKASELANAIDTYVKTGEVSVTITAANSGLQTSTSPGSPTGPPAAPATIGGAGFSSIS